MRHRIGAGLDQPGHRIGDGGEEGNRVVRQEGASQAVVGSYYLQWQGTVSMRERATP